MNIIAIDCGASFIKATLFKDDCVVKDKKITTPSDTDPKKLKKSIDIIKEIIQRFSVDLDVVHIGLSNEMHGFVLADQNGNPVTQYISWQKELGSINDCTHIFSKENICNTGMPLKTGLPSVNLYYISRQLQTPNNKLYFYTLGDYYISYITGKPAYCHPTNAAGTGLYNIIQEDWDFELIREVLPHDLADKIIFPQIYRDQEPIKCEMHGKSYYFYPALGDQQAALLGAGLNGENQLSLNFGTGAQISVLSNKAEFSSAYQIRPFFNGMYLKTVPHIPSGRALNVYFRFVKEILTYKTPMRDAEIWNYINAKAEGCKEDSLEIDMSFFSNAITDHKVGSIGNIQEYNLTVGNLFSSAYCQISRNIESVYQIMGRPYVNEVVISGGLLNKNTFLRNMVLKKFSEVKQIKLVNNETAIGIKTFIKNLNTGDNK